jgi:hypothetical protein
MAKIGGPPSLQDRAHFKRRVLFRDRKGGTPVVAKWPAPRGHALPNSVLANIGWFIKCNALTKLIDPSEMVEAINLTVGSGWYPRDLLLRAMSGGLVVAYMADGRVLWGRQDMANNIEAMLDSIGMTRGSVLFRGELGWLALSPGTVGQALESGGPNADPAWQNLPSLTAARLAVKSSATGNTNDTTEDTLWTYTLPGGTLAADGDAVHVEAVFGFAQNAHSKAARIYFGATAVALVTGLTTNLASLGALMRCTVTRTGAATQISGAAVLVGVPTAVAAFSFVEALAPAETLSGNVVIKITGQTGTAAANDVVLKTASVRLW